MSDLVVSLALPTMFGVGAIGMAALSIASFRKTSRWRTEGVTVEGEIVDFVQRELPPRENLEERDERVQKYSPVLLFVTTDGKEHRVTSSAAEPFGTYSAGQRLPVRYLPSSPDQADLEKMAVSNVPGVAFAILSLLSGAVAIIVFNAGQGQSQ